MATMSEDFTSGPQVAPELTAREGLPEEPAHEASRLAAQLSKRAARRIIQRALVLAGRDRLVRQQLRTVQFAMRWEIEDWNFGWTVLVDRGRLDFERRPAGRRAVTFIWDTASAFWSDVESSTWAGAKLTMGDVQPSRHALDTFYRAFCASLRGVLANPVDADGESLV
jgi:hypothetical protein